MRVGGLIIQLFISIPSLFPPPFARPSLPPRSQPLPHPPDRLGPEAHCDALIAGGLAPGPQGPDRHAHALHRGAHQPEVSGPARGKGEEEWDETIWNGMVYDVRLRFTLHDHCCRQISDLGLAHLRSLRKLEGLEVCGGGLTDSCGKVLAQMAHLKYLNISRNVHISDEILQYLAPLVGLEHINLNCTAVSINGLAETIPKLKSIRQLSIKNCQRVRIGVR